MRTDGRTNGRRADRHDEANSHFSKLAMEAYPHSFLTLALHGIA